jgi:TetR/AcrR family transcriptional regulator, mexJK operon transcriptional repressor
MDSRNEKRSDRKHREIMQAASAVFVAQGYDGTSMDEIASKAGVSKQTIYKHFSDKDNLFTAIILQTLGRNFLKVLMDEELLQIRRLVIANADRMPSLGRKWYEQGFERVLATLSSCFRALADKKLLHVEDPRLAANHFVGMLLWIPVNEAMFTGNNRPRSAAELNRLADAAVRAFLAAYGARP